MESKTEKHERKISAYQNEKKRKDNFKIKRSKAEHFTWK